MGSLLDRLNLRNDTIKHYATWVRKAGLFQINQLQPDKRYLHIICFMVHQYHLRQNIFSDILLNCVKATQNASIKNEKEQAFKGGGKSNGTKTYAKKINHKHMLGIIHPKMNRSGQQYSGQPLSKKLTSN